MQPHQRAKQLADKGDWSAAERLYRRVLLGSPRSIEALRGLGVLLQRQGRNGEAIGRLGAALKIKPDDAVTLADLGRAQAAAGDRLAAVESYDRSLAIDPAQARIWDQRGVTLAALGRVKDAVESFDRAVALDPGSAITFYNLAAALGRLERIDEALATYDRALAVDPELIDAINDKVIMLEELGRFDEAVALIKQGIALRPRAALFYFRLAELAELSPDDPHVKTMATLASDEAGLTEWDRAYLNFSLAKVLTDAGDHDGAFSYLLTANAQRRHRVDYDEGTTLGAIEALPRVFTRELMEGGAQLGDPSDQPIFVLGMPRSGTTLVEQILASHPKVFGAGETNLFNTVLQSSAASIDPGDASGPGWELWAESMRGLGESYLRALRERTPEGAKRIVDKTLENWRVIGLIRLALPNARIVHVHRNPLDACVSCFSRQFLNLPYTYDLAELGRHYKAYVALMEHWRQVTPEHILLDVRYEDIVGDLEGQARRLIAYCGLDWDPSCLEFHRTERRVRTASVAQVRRPIYDSSIGRWRVYEAHLAPLIEALGPELAV